MDEEYLEREALTYYGEPTYSVAPDPFEDKTGAVPLVRPC